MEARLLAPGGRRTPAASALSGSVVPALLPRMSPVELGILGGMRGGIGPSVPPAGAPSELLVHQIRVRSALVRYYLDQMPVLTWAQRAGVDVLCDIVTVLHLERWTRPSAVAEAMRPLRHLVGPEEQLGFGPAYDEVLEVLHGIADVGGSARRVSAVNASWRSRPEEYWDRLADTLLATAQVLGREVSLRMLARVAALDDASVRRSPVFRATRLRAAAVILSDVLDPALVVDVSEAWEAGVAAGPTLLG